MEIVGKTALVLGAARGIGREIGMALATAGATVVLTHFDWPEDAAVMQQELAALGGGHFAIKVDLRERDQVRKMLQTIRQRLGRLDILINNVERGGMPVVHGAYDRETNRDQWQLELDTTLKAKWLVFEEALPLLKASPEGAVVTISSIAGQVGRSGPAALLFSDGYAAANRAISSLTENWARQAAPNVRVNELMLGIFETRHAAGTRGWDLLTAADRDAIVEHTLLRRIGTFADIVKAVMFLVTAAYITGAVIRLDGGYVLGGESVPELPPGVVD